MPTPTFFNLPGPKQQRIYNAAVEEFARHRFSQSSINRIVKAAKIPRGSFYQYFGGKEDLYLYVLEQISHEKMKIFSRYQLSGPGRGFFQAVRASMPAIWDWTAEHPLYNRIGMLMLLDDSDFILRTVRKMDAAQDRLVSLLKADQEKGYIRRDVDLELVAQMYLSIFGMALQGFLEAGSREEAVTRIQAIFDILFLGIQERGKEPPDEKNC